MSEVCTCNVQAQNWSSEQGTSSLAEEDEEKEKVNLDGHVFAPVSYLSALPQSLFSSHVTDLSRPAPPCPAPPCPQCPHSLTCPLATAGSDTTVAMGTRGGPCRFGQRVSLDYSNVINIEHLSMEIKF